MAQREPVSARGDGSFRPGATTLRTGARKGKDAGAVGLTESQSKRVAVGLPADPSRALGGPERRASLADHIAARRAEATFRVTLGASLRSRAFRIVRSDAFWWCMLVVVLLNCLYMAIYTPSHDLHHMSEFYQNLVFGLNLGFALAFALEMGIHMTAVGFTGEYAYFKNFARWIEFLTVIVSWIDVAIELNRYKYVPAIRLVRGLRFFFFLGGSKTFRMVGRALFNSLKSMLPVFVVIGFTIILFGSYWNVQYRGLMQYRCVPNQEGVDILANPSNMYYNLIQQQFRLERPRRCSIRGTGRSCPQFFECAVDPAPDLVSENYDNILMAGYTVIRTMIFEAWAEAAYHGADADGISAYFTFIIVIFIGNFFALNFCVAIVIGEFQRSVADMYHKRAAREAFGLVEFRAIVAEIQQDPDLLREHTDKETGIRVPKSMRGTDLLEFLVVKRHVESAEGAKVVIKSMISFQVLQRVDVHDPDDPANPVRAAALAAAKGGESNALAHASQARRGSLGMLASIPSLVAYKKDRGAEQRRKEYSGTALYRLGLNDIGRVEGDASGGNPNHKSLVSIAGSSVIFM